MVLGLAKTFEEAIHMERDYFDQVDGRDYKLIKLDTTKLTPASLAARVRNRFMVQDSGFTITFQSFGFKHGVPMDADAIIDVRFLPNPYYVDELREGTGNDDNVYHYVIDKPETEEYINHLTPTLSYLFNEFEKEGRDHLVVGFGCTGGQHRSVSLTNYFADYYSSFYQVNRLHRDAKH